MSKEEKAKRELIKPGHYAISCAGRHPKTPREKWHSRLWRSIFGQHLHCEECHPPVCKRIVAERMTRDQLREREPGCVIEG